MANDLNRCEFIGRLGRDVESKYLPSGGAVANFSIAVGRSWKKDGEKKEATTWVSVVAFDKLGEVCIEYLKKGSRIFVAGEWRTREWEKDGIKRYTTEIVASQMQMLDSRSDHAVPPANESVPEKPKPGAFDDFNEDIPW